MGGGLEGAAIPAAESSGNPFAYRMPPTPTRNLTPPPTPTPRGPRIARPTPTPRIARGVNGEHGDRVGAVVGTVREKLGCNTESALRINDQLLRRAIVNAILCGGDA